MKTPTGLIARMHILDPVHGPIPITQVEYEIISSPIFQRLRFITQLSQTHLVFPGATHNRFQHSLGAMYIMDKLLNTLKENEFLRYKEKDYKEIVQKMRLSALLHDCGHLPFSHTFENKDEEIDHEYFGKCIVERSSFKEKMEDYGINPKSVGGLITGKINATDAHFNELTELSPLLSSHADCDRMDYLLRDAYFTGVPYGTFDVNRIINFIALENRQIGFLEKAQDAIEDFLFSRYQMYRIVYIHKTVLCYELILKKIHAKFFKKYNDQLELPFFLPRKRDFKNADLDWFENKFSNLTERDFFISVNKLLRFDAIQKEDKISLKKLYERITYRKPIKNCYRFDNLAQVKKTEYCDREIDCYKKLKGHSNIVNHWSFLRYNPAKPIIIADPITKQGEEDRQDPKYIRIINKNPSKGEKIRLLQEQTNSYINSLARHHRVLICYYHQKEEAQKVIKELANKLID